MRIRGWPKGGRCRGGYILVHTYVPLFDVYHDTGRQQQDVVEFNFDIEWALSSSTKPYVRVV